MRDRFAEEEFGGTSLGDERRTARLVQIASAVLAKPDGRISAVFDDRAQREGAYRFVQNEDVDPDALREQAAIAAFKRAAGEPYVIVPIDGSTLTLPAAREDSELGPVGNRWSRELGAHAMSAIVLSSQLVPLGVGAQVIWTRERQERLSRSRTHAVGSNSPRTRRAIDRPISEKETAHWGTVIEDVLTAAKKSQFTGRIWFQLDAGADSAHLLGSAPLLDAWLTVRTKRDRRLLGEGLLLDEVFANASVGTMTVEVPETNNRPGRVATLELRYVPVVLSLQPRGEQGKLPAPLFAVSATEITPVPRDGAGIDWVLLTNRPGATSADAERVVRAYTSRWRIEETHKTWKSVTKVEQMGVHSLHAVAIWARILFSVAVRIERLKHFARTEPDAPASVEMSERELDALWRRRRNRAGATREALSIGTAVLWVADLGGYMNPHQGPPGSITIGRGLLRLLDRLEDAPEM